MNILSIIEKKRDKKELSKEEISYFVDGYVKGSIPDYQAAALIMAIYLNGMNMRETTNLTIAMAYSGKVIDLSEIGMVIDKHSTGGVGDKVSLILLPIIASLGIPVAKMSGRGLGFTGGTLDKLESIPGFTVNVDIYDFIQNVKKIGISIIGQTMDLVPADKKIYALRDSINCVGNKALIASSIMSKKIAAGANKIVLDVTCGSGAFMKTKEDAIELSQIMKEIGRLAGREVVCIITNMNEPLGRCVGNILEVKEAVQFLNGDMEKREKDIVFELGSYMMSFSEYGDNIENNKKMILNNIQNGKAYKKFIELIENQGGDISYIKDLERFPKAKYELNVISTAEGFVNSINTEQIGLTSVMLGAGRVKKDDVIDNTVGIEIYKKIGNQVLENDIIAKVYTNDKEIGQKAVNQIKKSFEILPKQVNDFDSIVCVI